MIIIKLLGVDQDQAESFTRDVHDQIAQAFEVEPEDLVFYAPYSFNIYKGIEQTSFFLNIEVEAPSKFKVLEKQASQVLYKAFNETHVHIRILFTYFDEENEYLYFNEDYPKFMTDSNMAHFDVEDEDTEPYMGNAFADYEERVKAKEQEQAKEERERLAKNKNN